MGVEHHPQILYIESDASLQEIVHTVLEEEGILVNNVTDQDLGTVEVQKRVPDLVLMNLPFGTVRSDIEGCSLLLALRTEPRFQQVPLVIMSTRKEDTLPQTLRDRCSSVVEMPFDIENLIGAVTRPLRWNPSV